MKGTLGINYNGIYYTAKKEELTCIDFTDNYKDKIKSSYTKFNPIIEPNDPNISVATAIVTIFKKKMYSFFGGTQGIGLGCSLQLNSIVLTFQDETFANNAMQEFAELKKQFKKFDAIKGKFNGKYIVIIPGAYIKEFITAILGFNEKAYNKLSRDVAMLQRAQLDGILDTIDVAEEGKTPKKHGVSASTMKWLINDEDNKGHCYIQPGSAIPIRILLDVLNEEFKTNDAKYKTIIDKFIPEDQNSKLTIIYRKGEYNPYEKGYLTESLASVFLCYALRSNYIANEELCGEANKLLLKSKLLLLNKCDDELSKLDKASIEYLDTLTKCIENITNSLNTSPSIALDAERKSLADVSEIESSETSSTLIYDARTSSFKPQDCLEKSIGTELKECIEFLEKEEQHSKFISRVDSSSSDNTIRHGNNTFTKMQDYAAPSRKGDVMRK